MEMYFDLNSSFTVVTGIDMASINLLPFVTAMKLHLLTHLKFLKLYILK